VFEKAEWLGEYITVDGEVCWVVGGDGLKFCGTASEGVGKTMGLMVPEAGTRDALSKKVPNLPKMVCHSSHFFLDVKRLYRMLLRNSTSMICTS
jgi:hypothetical protein